MMFEDYAKDQYWDEMADALIRILDHAAANQVDIETRVLAKVRYNALRPHKHGGKKY